MRNLFTPWRHAYVSSGRRERGCLFCRLRDSKEDGKNLVVLRGRHNFIVLNRYPYNNGHLMIVPYAHVAELSRGTPRQLTEMMSLASRCERVLQRLYRTHGFNLGMNLGAPAGAGVLGHFHLHLVPRWEGDTNFMTVMSETRITPETLDDTRRRLALSLKDRRKPAGRRPRAKKLTRRR